ncbi:SAM-dependent methyltransferase [Streptomyces sp. NPDC058001]|uniref:SAM-dependent methyltransferase n=1 Tax=Streptomyces sp. NPDC058001 TaxID=3346300 RepID=UPI0036E394C4
MGHGASAASRIDTRRAHPARVYDYILGGKDNYPVDAEAAAAMVAALPSLPVTMRQNRLFMHRVTRYLARDAGIRQFLDIGTGLPTSPNLHEVAQREQPDASVVYVDNDPIVLTYAQALLKSSPEGRTGYVDADMRDPDAILESEAFQELLDLKQPVGLMIIAMLHFIPIPDGYALVRRLLDPLPSGSFLAISTGTSDFAPQEAARKMVGEYESRGIRMIARDRTQVAAFFDGLELVEPGLTQAHHWRPTEEQASVDDSHVAMYAAVGRKP